MYVQRKEGTTLETVAEFVMQRDADADVARRQNCEKNIRVIYFVSAKPCANWAEDKAWLAQQAAKKLGAKRAN